MDDETTSWTLAVTSFSGFAIPKHNQSQETQSQWESIVHHTMSATDISLSQTYETHQFPYYLHITLSSRSPSDEGLSVYLPLNQIRSIVHCEHGSSGQSLKFKLGPEQRYGTIRQDSKAGIPGKIYGPNEDDPFRVWGLLKFREFVVRNPAVGGDELKVLEAWLMCLKRNAKKASEGHVIQIISEGQDGIWRILENSDDEASPTKSESLNGEGLSSGESGDSETPMEIVPSVIVPEGSVMEEPLQTRRNSPPRQMITNGAVLAITDYPWNMMNSMPPLSLDQDEFIIDYTDFLDSLPASPREPKTDHDVATSPEEVVSPRNTPPIYSEIAVEPNATSLTVTNPKPISQNSQPLVCREDLLPPSQTSEFHQSRISPPTGNVGNKRSPPRHPKRGSLNNHRRSPVRPFANPRRPLIHYDEDEFNRADPGFKAYDAYRPERGWQARRTSEDFVTRPRQHTWRRAPRIERRE